MKIKKTNQPVLIMTGCVRPNNNVPYLRIKDPEERYRQYVRSIKWYINTSEINSIVFCDNSNYKINSELVSYAKKRGKELEWLAFSGNEKKQVKYGKGYGEGEILKYVIDNSTLVREGGYMIKVTGRLMIKNINQFIHRYDPDAVYLYVGGDGKHNIIRKKESIDTRFYAMPCEVYKKVFMNTYLNVNDPEGIYLEKTFFNAFVLSHIKVRSIFFYPSFIGVSGTGAKTYTGSNGLILLKTIFSGLGSYRPQR